MHIKVEMEEDLNSVGKWKTTSIFLEMEGGDMIEGDFADTCANKRKVVLIVDTTLRMQCPRAVQALRSEQ